jgi:hypothetical protein
LDQLGGGLSSLESLRCQHQHELLDILLLTVLVPLGDRPVMESDGVGLVLVV